MRPYLRFSRSALFFHWCRSESYNLSLGRGKASKSADDDAFSEDPIITLRKIQNQIKEKSLTNSSFPPRQHAKKTMFFEQKPQATEKSNNNFMKKVLSLESDNEASFLSEYATDRENRAQKKAEKIKVERSKLLKFRDVGFDLDKPILSRDIFLIWKYFLLGKQFAIDNELERMLRYFNEHAINELKIIHNSKLMRGTETLLKTSIGSMNAFTSSPSCKSSYSIKFPTIICANVAQFCSNPSPTVSSFLAQKFFSSPTFFKRFVERRKNENDAPLKYSTKSSSLNTVISSSTFVRPAVVILTQLGQKFGAEADKAWRKLAYSSICPGSNFFAERKSSQPQSPLMDIDVISIRTFDLYSYKWAQKLYISRFINSLNSEETMENQLIASTTFVGTKVLHPFFDSFGLRNYLSPYVFLVDSHGNIRWISSGMPDNWETKKFPSLVRELNLEYSKK